MPGLVEGKHVVIYGAGGRYGSALAQAFAREGASLFLAGRRRGALEEVAALITGSVQVAEVDVLDADQVEAHAAAVVDRAGRIDVSMNVAGFDELQDVPLIEMSPDDFARPIAERARANFLTATAAGRRMVDQGSGVIVNVTASSARESRFQMGGFSVACAAIEGFTRSLAGELGPRGVRVVCVRSNFIPETYPEIALPDDHDLITTTLLRRLPRLDEVVDTAVFVASDRAGAMTGAVVNVTCGAIVD